MLHVENILTPFKCAFSLECNYLGTFGAKMAANNHYTFQTELVKVYLSDFVWNMHNKNLQRLYIDDAVL